VDGDTSNTTTREENNNKSDIVAERGVEGADTASGKVRAGPENTSIDSTVNGSPRHAPPTSSFTNTTNNNNETNGFSPTKDSDLTPQDKVNEKCVSGKKTVILSDRIEGREEEEEVEASSEASSSVGSSLDSPSSLSPLAPHFVRKMVDCTAFKGDAVRFDVQVTCTTSPRLAWTLEDEPVEEDGRRVVEVGEDGHCSLIVRDVREEDEGEYACRASNSHGTAICRAELSVYGLGAV
jgi:hypothetical protein